MEMDTPMNHKNSYLEIRKDILGIQRKLMRARKIKFTTQKEKEAVRDELISQTNQILDKANEARSMRCVEQCSALKRSITETLTEYDLQDDLENFSLGNRGGNDPIPFQKLRLNVSSDDDDSE